MPHTYSPENKQGWNDRCAGVSEDDNPHRQGSILAYDWWCGWYRADLKIYTDKRAHRERQNVEKLAELTALQNNVASTAAFDTIVLTLMNRLSPDYANELATGIRELIEAMIDEKIRNSS